MEDKPSTSSLMDQEQINRLTQTRQYAEEVELLTLRRRLKQELRCKHYENRWIKPLDLCSMQTVVLVSAILLCLATLAKL